MQLQQLQHVPPHVQIDMATHRNRSRFDHISSCCRPHDTPEQSYLDRECPIQIRTFHELINEHFTQDEDPYLLAEAIDVNIDIRNWGKKGNSVYCDGYALLDYYSVKQQFVMPSYHAACDKVHFYFLHRKDNLLVKTHYATYTSYEAALLDFAHLRFKGNENATIKAREKLLLHVFQNEFDETGKRWIATWNSEPHKVLPAPFSRMPCNDESIERFLTLQRLQKLKEKVKQISTVALGSVANVLLDRFLPLKTASIMLFVMNGLLTVNGIRKYLTFKPNLYSQLASIGFSAPSVIRGAMSKQLTGPSAMNLVSGGISLLSNLICK